MQPLGVALAAHLVEELQMGLSDVRDDESGYQKIGV
jgi:hypothetical protein